MVRQIISIDNYDSGIVRVLMNTVDSYDGNGKGQRIWQFAACKRGMLAYGYSSNGADAQWSSVFQDGGSPIDGGSGANAYSQWLAMCRY